MRLIDEQTACKYLRSTGRIGAQESIRVQPLAGGVSNIVLLVTRERGESFVLKQAREQLRVAQPWFCSVERIWREVQVLRACERVCQVDGEASTSQEDLSLCTPRLLFEDRDNYCYGMSAAPQHVVWKQLLLAGKADKKIAAACGRFLALLHGRTWEDEKLAAELGDRQFFVDLRVDPYYRAVQRRHADLSGVLEELIESVTTTQLALVHGDYSPKNLLVYHGGVMLVDFEVGHFGDPAFDLGFFMTHLLLKAVRAEHDAPRFLQLAATFQKSYELELRRHVDRAAERDALYDRSVLNLGGCMLARIDGKSPVEYLSTKQQDAARTISRSLLAARPAWRDVVDRVSERLSGSPTELK